MDQHYRRLWTKTRGLCADTAEYVVAAYVDRHLRLLATCIIARGEADSCSVHPRDVFGVAVRMGAYGVILGHTHPSGRPEPSLADREATAVLERAAQNLRIPIFGHIVLTKHAWNVVQSV